MSLIGGVTVSKFSSIRISTTSFTLFCFLSFCVIKLLPISTVSHHASRLDDLEHIVFEVADLIECDHKRALAAYLLRNAMADHGVNEGVAYYMSLIHVVPSCEGCGGAVKGSVVGVT